MVFVLQVYCRMTSVLFGNIVVHPQVDVVGEP